MKSVFQEARAERRESRTRFGRFRSGKLAPVMGLQVEGSEGGVVSQTITMELDPIAGRLVSPVWGEFISVFVPAQAIDAIKDPEADYAGMTEVLREKFLGANPVFPLEVEGELSKRMKVNPIKIAGAPATLRVTEAYRLAHNAAVNYLRQRLYTYAGLITHANTGVTPALISQTVLEKFNAVLDPDDRINGRVDLSIPNMQLPVTGIGINSGASFGTVAQTVRTNQPGNEPGDPGGLDNYTVRLAMSSSNMSVKGTATDGYPDIWAHLSGASAGNVSLVDFYNAEKKDRLTRTMRKIVDDNPQYGEEQVVRWAHGLSVDMGKIPFVIHEERRMFGRDLVTASDKAGVEADTMRSDMVLRMSFTVPIPKTELGGVIVTFACVKPDEVLASQPHPIGTRPWGARNFAADQLQLDPVPVRMRELDSGISDAAQATIAFYTGYNALSQYYVDYGPSRTLDPETVENKTAIWQLQVPLSVTPSNILYPETLSQYPFADQNAEVCLYTISCQARFLTPIVFGPTPVETLAAIDGEDLFEEE